MLFKCPAMSISEKLSIVSFQSFIDLFNYLVDFFKLLDYNFVILWLHYILSFNVNSIIHLMPMYVNRFMSIILRKFSTGIFTRENQDKMLAFSSYFPSKIICTPVQALSLLFDSKVCINENYTTITMLISSFVMDHFEFFFGCIVLTSHFYHFLLI